MEELNYDQEGEENKSSKKALVYILIGIVVLILFIGFIIFVGVVLWLIYDGSDSDTNISSKTLEDSCNTIFTNLYPDAQNFIPFGRKAFTSSTTDSSTCQSYLASNIISYSIVNNLTDTTSIRLLQTNTYTTIDCSDTLGSVAVFNYDLPPNGNKYQTNCMYPNTNNFISYLYNNMILQIQAKDSSGAVLDTTITINYNSVNVGKTVVIQSTTPATDLVTISIDGSYTAGTAVATITNLFPVS